MGINKCKKGSSVDPEKPGVEPDIKTLFLEAERKKPHLNDFTLNEYTEKVIQYGFIVVSGSSSVLCDLNKAIILCPCFQFAMRSYLCMKGHYWKTLNL